MLTARDSEQDQVDGFRLGVDDYICKPFSNAVLLGHIEAVLKRSSIGVGAGTSKQIGKLKVDSENKRVFLHDKDLGLTAKEYGLLTYFMDNPNIVVLRENILNQVWGYNYVGDTRTVDVHVKRLRPGVIGADDRNVMGFGKHVTAPARNGGTSFCPYGAGSRPPQRNPCNRDRWKAPGRSCWRPPPPSLRKPRRS